MKNIADLIEDYILQRLASEQDGYVELRRADIADEISCAPSQISYVLNTRFTHDRGFDVESRRGLGGFIKIIQLSEENPVYQDMISKIDYDTKEVMVQSMIRYLLKHQMITSREAAIMIQVVSVAYTTMAPADRVKMIKSLIMMLEQFS